MITVTYLSQNVLLIGCILAPSFVRGDDPVPGGKSVKGTPAFVAYIDAIRKETDEKLEPIYDEIRNEMEDAKSDIDRESIFQSHLSKIEAVNAAGTQRALEEITPHASDSAAVEPLIWIANSGSQTDAGNSAAKLLMKYHLVRKETVELASNKKRSPNRWCEAMLRAQLGAQDLPEDLRCQVMLSLAVCLKSRGEVAAMLPDADETLKKQFEQSFGDDYFAKVLKTGPTEYEAEAIHLFTEVGDRYPNEEIRKGATVGEFARNSIFQIEHLGIGRVAPDIEGEDIDGVKFRLSNYRGKVVMLTFWANWCVRCMAAVPHENELVEQYKHRPFELIGVNSDPDREKLKSVLEETRGLRGRLSPRGI
jgi:thiol-disulfide isomerase/thioredoxin